MASEHVIYRYNHIMLFSMLALCSCYHRCRDGRLRRPRIRHLSRRRHPVRREYFDVRLRRECFTKTQQFAVFVRMFRACCVT